MMSSQDDLIILTCIVASVHVLIRLLCYCENPSCPCASLCAVVAAASTLNMVSHKLRSCILHSKCNLLEPVTGIDGVHCVSNRQ